MNAPIADASASASSMARAGKGRAREAWNCHATDGGSREKATPRMPPRNLRRKSAACGAPPALAGSGRALGDQVLPRGQKWPETLLDASPHVREGLVFDAGAASFLHGAERRQKTTALEECLGQARPD